MQAHLMLICLVASFANGLAKSIVSSEPSACIHVDNEIAVQSRKECTGFQLMMRALM